LHRARVLWRAQNQCRAFAGFKGMLDATKYQELMPDPFDRFAQVV
jgi:hypothetical protein